MEETCQALGWNGGRSLRRDTFDFGVGEIGISCLIGDVAKGKQLAIQTILRGCSEFVQMVLQVLLESAWFAR
jgi:hypothetical protein